MTYKSRDYLIFVAFSKKGLKNATFFEYDICLIVQENPNAMMRMMTESLSQC